MRDKQITREKILNAGKEEFLKKGYEASGLRGIASAAGVTTGAIYGHFKDKSEMLECLVRPVIEGFLELRDTSHREFLDKNTTGDLKEMEAVQESNGDQLLDHMVDYIYDHFDIFRLIIVEGRNIVYQDFISRVIESEVQAARQLFHVYGLYEHADAVSNEKELIDDFINTISSSYYTNIFEIVRLNYSRDRAKVFVGSLSKFYSGGWVRMLDSEASGLDSH